MQHFAFPQLIPNTACDLLISDAYVTRGACGWRVSLRMSPSRHPVLEQWTCGIGVAQVKEDKNLDRVVYEMTMKLLLLLSTKIIKVA